MIARRAVGWLVAVTLASSAVSSAAAEETAVDVFKKVQGSVVALSNLEGSGTGIILDKSGLILTNAHVVASPLPYKCKVDVIKRGGKSETVTFNRVRLLGVHPKADLALVRIDPKEHKGSLQPAKIAKYKATPGQQVFAIGNPSAGGQVLNKSITQGILSGVDRIVKGEDAVKYYQVDAAINPGNSGGPLCDKEGRVLGVVTLKFEDADNTGYAIPLYELNTTVFVPFKQRKGDPARSKIMLEQASKYYKKAKDRTARFGKDDEGAEFYRGIAAWHYRQALTHDPSNHSIYYNVGMLLRTLDEDEAAAAYLLQAIQLKPWAKDNEYYYRELGYSLVKQKKMKEARVVWEEGIAKYPRTAAKIWEDLTIYWGNEADHYRAAYHAKVVLHLNDAKNTRLPVMQSMYEGNVKAITDAAKKAAFDKAVTAIGPMIKKRLKMAAAKRKADKGYMTDAFAAFVENNGSIASDEGAGSLAIEDENPAKDKPAPGDAKPTPAETAAAEAAAAAVVRKRKETAAAATLRIAKGWQTKGNKSLANKWYKKVVATYPETAAAAQARKLLGIAPPKPALRTWVDSTGKFRIQATLEGVKDGVAQLRRDNGKILSLRVSQLSAADQQYIKRITGQ